MLLLRLAASQEEQIDSATLADLLDAIAAAHDDFAYEAAMELLVTHLTPDDQELLPHLERLAVGLRPLLLRRAARGNGQADRLFETLGRQGPAAVPLICQLTTGPLATDGLRALKQAARDDPASVEVILNACLGRPEKDVDAFIDCLETLDPKYAVTRRFLSRPEADVDPAILPQACAVLEEPRPSVDRRRSRRLMAR